MFLYDPSFWFFAPLPVIFIGLVLTPMMPSRDLAHQTTAWSVVGAVVGLAAAAFWSWFFKDGLGPGFVPSHGLRAWLRFARLFWFSLVVFGGALLASVWVCRRRLAGLERSMRR